MARLVPEQKGGCTQPRAEDTISKPKIFNGKVSLRYFTGSNSKIDMPYLYFTAIDSVWKSICEKLIICKEAIF